MRGGGVKETGEGRGGGGSRGEGQTEGGFLNFFVKCFQKKNKGVLKLLLKCQQNNKLTERERERAASGK